jgi:hypothetical protein
VGAAEAGVIRHDLADTLAAFVESVSPPSGGPLRVTDVDLTVPLEVSTGVGRDGELLFFAQPPHSRFKSGLLPQVHLSRLHVVALDSEAEDAR